MSKLSPCLTLLIYAAALWSLADHPLIVVTATRLASPPPTSAPEHLVASIPSSDAIRVWISPDVQPELSAAFGPLITTSNFTSTDEADNAQVKLTDGPPAAGLNAQWVYTPVAAFPT